MVSTATQNGFISLSMSNMLDKTIYDVFRRAKFWISGKALDGTKVYKVYFLKGSRRRDQVTTPPFPVRRIKKCKIYRILYLNK